MTADDAIHTIRQRRDYLTERIAAKRNVSYDVEYDTRERDALTWALRELHQESPACST